ncbi:MAG: hypothetical protein A3B91_01685 [Candidatus Yanofskybacteria bacterium RIFCSPHIGHO2_02_FULL_41_29]|uniref:POTRA domain-containing protein n=1 Tax=Candidatus Yanofskybacteria bacterium RIFCSPHIGHO2_01_FULL_41_53 TaxID=1802663 RepID=A0A1F8EI88_9BACT|nr:MAG: hypothetical protein A2650_03115 [Candidatus Yanofskybacteria bacterium RIFCSPHIGHO2_01_FULL_41_53]OGN11837.1 MAG: hypothetical protein A3B91_01685 [Candidatus Yanofskybacteria bacterium RIFCSPHIGHO2_02_FULL_41_29]OGN17257.1 MAG: hypothetical protein A3F48_03585 [Candidatus Yanofskybacteria bacterium RIFCSPHIGHO2_12_FULL_41_9]OGN23085.1 MAG: hypothetical protein A2916_05035 [Candidatus Yanofskybacteria bacterium RIFCSPLOWO2_01_FULL_41_67]OGN29888.1 MAG: hypothetical protein A3H54_03790 
MAGYNYNRYGDNLARKKRRYFFLKLVIALSSILGVFMLVIYVAFFSPFLQIQEVNIEGLKSVKSEEIFSIVDSFLNQVILEPISIKPQKNMFFLDEKLLVSQLKAQFPAVKEINIQKNYPHTVIVSINERTSWGTWCFNSEDCRYFDNEGILWGDSLRSSGALLLLVDDMRDYENQPRTIDQVFLDGVKSILSGLEELSIQTARLEIPIGSIEDVFVDTTENYRILFSVNSDIDNQIKVLKIFLADKDKGFEPEYIDLRIEGRVYYK